MTETVGQALDVDALRRKYADERARRLRADGIAEHHDRYRDACLRTDAREIRWDAGRLRWIIRTDRGDEMRGPTEYADILLRWRADGDLDDMLICRSGDGP